MKSDTVYENMKNALSLQKKLLEEAKNQISKVKGFLFVRQCGQHKLYYQGIKVKADTGWKTILNNISNELDLVRELAQKGLNKKLLQTYQKNIATLEKALNKYVPLTSEVLMPDQYKEILVENGKSSKYKQFPFDPKAHRHATVCGIMVRSKAEVIIANALWHYGISFVYEELFPHLSEDGTLIYPDFTIHLPDGRTIIWEHWGMLDKETYCARNAEKLYTYNANHYVIGKNLIITQDDVDGGCDSALVYHIIENYILPYFK